MMGDAFDGEKKPLGCFAKVVIGTLLGLVALALLFPVFASSGPQNHRPVCISNLKQLSTAQFIYAADFEDSLPPNYSFEGSEAKKAFVEATYAYAKNGLIYTCPFSSEAKLEGQFTNPLLGYDHFPLILRKRNSKGVINLTLIQDPAKDVWMHDSIVKLEVKDDGEHVETHHGPGKSGFFVSFFDGHARWASTISGQSKDWINTMGVWQE